MSEKQNRRRRQQMRAMSQQNIVTYQGNNVDMSARRNYSHVSLTDSDIDQCVMVQIGQAVHYIHADTAVNLRNKLTTALRTWNDSARKDGFAGLPLSNESEEDYYNLKVGETKIASIALGEKLEYIPSDDPIPEDMKL
jgi:hypothetical protein